MYYLRDSAGHGITWLQMPSCNTSALEILLFTALIIIGAQHHFAKTLLVTPLSEKPCPVQTSSLQLFLQSVRLRILVLRIHYFAILTQLCRILAI